MGWLGRRDPETGLSGIDLGERIEELKARKRDMQEVHRITPEPTPVRSSAEVRSAIAGAFDAAARDGALESWVRSLRDPAVVASLPEGVVEELLGAVVGDGRVKALEIADELESRGFFPAPALSPRHAIAAEISELTAAINRLYNVKQKLYIESLPAGTLG
jgi:hypothetical protein